MTHIRPTIVSLLLFTILFGGIYPFMMDGLGKAFFIQQAQGSVITDRAGKPLGSELIGQNFTKPQYFWGRLSATAPTPYNAAASSGSNYSTMNPSLFDAAKARADALRAADPANSKPIPVDLVTASGSGLDPHISLAAAEYQLPRVARARGISEDRLRGLVVQFTEQRQFGILGEPRVNVLKLNLKLDGKL